MFCHIILDLKHLDSSIPTPVCNDNCGAVIWSNSFSTKGIHHVNIHENAVREARLLGEVTIQHIPGSANPSDLFTKEFKSNATFHQLCNLVLFYPSAILVT
jgi:hypothetical protein